MDSTKASHVLLFLQKLAGDAPAVVLTTHTYGDREERGWEECQNCGINVSQEVTVLPLLRLWEHFTCAFMQLQTLALPSLQQVTL